MVAGAGRRDAAAHDAVDRRSSSSTSWRTRPTQSSPCSAMQGFSFARQRPEQRHGVRQAEGLGRAQAGRTPASTPSPAAPWARFGADQGRDGVRVRAAADAGTGHRGGLQLLPEGQRRPRPSARCVDARNQLLGAASAEQAAGQRASQRPGRHAAVSASTWTRQRPRALGLSIADINSTLVNGLGRPVHRRLHRPRPRQARLRAGRRAVPHGAGGFQSLVGAQ